MNPIKRATIHFQNKTDKLRSKQTYRIKSVLNSQNSAAEMMLN